MRRFQQRPTPLITGGLALALALVFLSEFYTALGITVWVLYLIPLVLSYLTWNPAVPVIIGAVVTLMMFVGLFISPAGIDPSLALMNRSMGVVTAIALAALGHQFVSGRLAVRREEWVRVGQTVLSERMIGDQSLRTLGENVLHGLAAYLGAQGGAIFIEEAGEFHRTATYGVPDGSPIPDRLRSGDGLLGRALHEQQPIVVQDLPDGYFTIG